MSKCLMVIDVQNGFLSESTNDALPRIVNLMDEFREGPIIATQFINVEDSAFIKYMNWHRLMQSPEIDIPPLVSKRANYIVKKNTYSALTKEVLEILRAESVTEVFLAGIDTDCCVLATAIDLFDLNICPIVLEHYCKSNGGERSHTAALTVLERIIGPQHIISGAYSLDTGILL